MKLIITIYPEVYTNIKKYLLDKKIEDYLIITHKKNYNDYNSLKCEFVNEFKKESILSKAISYKNIEQVISFGEKDILIAAYIRTVLNIKGQKIDNAEIFRNKYLMKKTLRNQGFLVPDFEYNLTEESITKFLSKYKKAILKPLYGVASRDIFIINDYSDYLKVKRDHKIDEYMIEEFVEFESMYSIDSLVVDNKVFISVVHKYNIDPLHMTGTKKWHIVTQLDIDSAFSKMLVELQDSLVMKLKNESKSYGMHTEVFQTKENEILICETTCRFGGARIPDLINNAFEINLFDIYLDSLFRNCDINMKSLTQKNKVCSILIPKVTGMAEGFPSERQINFSFVSEYSCYIKNGEYIYKMKHSVDSAAVLVLSVEKQEDLNKYIKKIEKYFPY